MTAIVTDRATRVIARCRKIAACTEVPGETTRTFLSEPMRAVHALLRGWMETAGMEVRVDAAGNLRGILRGAGGGGARVIVASHLDTVRNAGAFDGVLGVVAGVSLAEEVGVRKLPFDLEVIGFSEEEGVRFSRPFLGSLAVVGQLGGELLKLTDRDGVSVAEAIGAYGLDSLHIPGARLAPKVIAYLELHIEQGPVLDSAGLQLGLVETIAGQTRVQMTFVGEANHAGTTPMHLRRDAMTAAAEWIVLVETSAQKTAGLVATVGQVTTLPGAGNVIAGEVRASLDVRHAEDEVRVAAVDSLLRAATEVARKRGVSMESRIVLEQAAVAMDGRLVSMLEGAAGLAGYQGLRMTSGAGHDAMVIAPVVASAMLFVRSPGGVSHHPDEVVLVEDVEAALATGIEFLTLLGSSPG